MHPVVLYIIQLYTSNRNQLIDQHINPYTAREGDEGEGNTDVLDEGDNDGDSDIFDKGDEEGDNRVFDEGDEGENNHIPDNVQAEESPQV